MPLVDPNTLQRSSKSSWTKSVGDLLRGLYTVGANSEPLLAEGMGRYAFIESQTASSSSSLDFTTGIGTRFDHYIFRLTNILPGTSGSILYLRVSDDGGATFEAGTGYEYGITAPLSTGITHVGFASTGAAQIILSNTHSNNAGDGLSGKVEAYAPAAGNPKFDMALAYRDGATFVSWKGDALFNGNSNAINGFQFLYSAGNIASGKIALYGIANA